MWNAMPTARIARGVDIIAYNRNCSKIISIQVKTLSKRNPVPLSEHCHLCRPVYAYIR